MSSTSKQVDQLVMVVHGVGDPEPGDTLSKLARSIAGDSQPLTESQSVLWLGEPEYGSKRVHTFPCHVRELEFKESRVQLAEIFWGDLSRVRHGVIGVVVGLFEILFGLRYVGYVAADQKGRAAQVLKRLGHNATRLIHGPVLAVCFMLALLTVAIGLTETMWSDSHRAEVWNAILVSGCCVLALVMAMIGYRMTQNRVAKRFWYWTEVAAVFVGLLVVVENIVFHSSWATASHSHDALSGLLWYCRVLVTMLGWLWFVETCMIVAAAACWLVACANPKNYRPALHIAFLVPAAVVGFWGLALPITWLTTANFLRRYAALEDFEYLFHSAVPMMGVQVAMGTVVLAIAGVSLAHYALWRRRHADFEHGGDDPGRPPRLVVSKMVQVALGGSAIIGVLLVGMLEMMQFLGYSYEETALGCMMAEANKYAVGVLFPTAFLAFMVLPKLQPVLDIVLDVVNHFNFRDTGINDILNDEDEFDINETTFDSGRLFFHRRDAIHVRFKTALAHYRDKISGRPDLTIISHSQGTIVAIETLNDPDLAWLHNQFNSVTLVTMGSPFSHLYQNYFQHFYPELEAEYWESLREQLDRWINIYRIDDFVGTKVDFPVGKRIPTPQHPNGFYSNHSVGPRGHMNYWVDTEVLKILRWELMGARDDEDMQGFRYRQSA